MKKILVSFEQGEKGLIAKSTSDNGAWVVPGRNERHQMKPSADKFLVEIIGQTKNERLRFCKVLTTLQLLADKFISDGQADYTEITPNGSVYIARKIAEGINLFFICDERNGSKFYVKFCSCLDWAGTIGNDLLYYYDSPLPVQELPPNSRLHQEITLARAAFKKAEQDKELAKIARNKEVQVLSKKAAQYPNDDLFQPLLALIKKAKEAKKQSGSAIWLKDDKLGYFAKFKIEELNIIVQALSSGIVHVSYSYSSSGGGEKYLYCVAPNEYLTKQKELFLQEHPEFAAEKDSPDFWTRAVRKYGTYEGCSEEHLGYGHYQDKHHYKLRVGDYFLSRTFDGDVSDEGPIYL